MQYSGAGGKLIHQKNQKQKISWHCPCKAGSFIVWKKAGAKYTNETYLMHLEKD